MAKRRLENYFDDQNRIHKMKVKVSYKLLKENEETNTFN